MQWVVSPGGTAKPCLLGPAAPPPVPPVEPVPDRVLAPPELTVPPPVALPPFPAPPMPRPMESVFRHAVRFEFLKSARHFRVQGVGLFRRST